MQKKIIFVSLLLILALSLNFVSMDGYFGLQKETIYVEKTWNTLSTPNLANPNVEFAKRELIITEVDN